MGQRQFSESAKSLSSKEILEPRARVELATCRLRIGCSTTELPRPLIIKDLLPQSDLASNLRFNLSKFRRCLAVLSITNAQPLRKRPLLHRSATIAFPPSMTLLLSLKRTREIDRRANKGRQVDSSLVCFPSQALELTSFDVDNAV